MLLGFAYFEDRDVQARQKLLTGWGVGTTTIPT